MKALIILFGLLLSNPIYSFDTLTIEPGLQGIKTDATGITVFQYLELPSELGAYVFKINNLPHEIHEKNIMVEEGGFNLIDVEWIKELPMTERKLDHKLYDRMLALKDRLKALDHEESEALKFKKELLGKLVDQHDILSVRDLYKEKDIAFKKERIRIYNELHLIQSEIVTIKDHFISPKVDSQGTLFLSIIKDQPESKVLRFNYFLAHPERRPMASNADGVHRQGPQKDSQLVKGRIIEAKSRIPLIYALIEIYEEGELIQTIHTDEMGIFETKLATGKNYSFLIFQEGYKDRKIKKFSAQASANVDYRTYTMKEKKSVSFTEFASYAVQVATLIAYNW